MQGSDLLAVSWLFNIALMVLMANLAKGRKTRFAWTGACLVFPPILTIIVFLIREAINTHRQKQKNPLPSLQG